MDKRAALDAIEAEYDRACSVFPPFNSAHEGWGVLSEEFDELWDEIKARVIDPGKIEHEATQVGAMAMRFLTDVCGPRGQVQPSFERGPGLRLIAAERGRQLDGEGFTAARDDQYVDGKLALAAVCYAAPSDVFVTNPWPWDVKCDKRLQYGSCKTDVTDDSGVLRPPAPATYTDDEALDLLVKAGALIAAEIDRRTRLRDRKVAAHE